MHPFSSAESEGRPSPEMHRFQPEIQGMRALSVVAVIWTHARFPGLPGGFTGVDVFFVISGFLITRLLLAEMTRTGGINLIAFWVRRMRRLLPNAFTVLIATVLLALLFFPGYDPAKLAKEITYAALNIANIHFVNEAVDYFQSENAASPILHFWSLSVEEQFYIIWPPMLLGLGLVFRQRLLRAAVLLLALVWCASFAASLYLTYVEQPFAYFGTAMRCWQLATGALIAAGWGHIGQLAQKTRSAMAWLGLGSILTGMVVIDEGMLYPGAWALLPTLGAAALIAGFGAANPHGLLRRGLSTPVMQWIGERSYSWYLWHWPLLALPRIVLADSPYIALIAVPVSLVLACLAYSWIETPIRKGRLLPARPLPTFAGAVAGFAMVIAAGYLHMPALFIKDPAMANRILALKAASDDQPRAHKEGCHLSRRQTQQSDCFYGDTGASRHVALFGDSHAVHWFEGLHRASRQAGWKLLSWTKSNCPSIDTPTFGNNQPYIACARWRDEVMTKLTGANRVNLVVLSNYMSSYARKVYDPVSGELVKSKEAQKAVTAGLRRTIERFLAAGVDVAIIRDTPKPYPRFRDCFIVKPGDCARPREEAMGASEVEDVIEREFAGRIKFLDFTDLICEGAKCPLTRNGIMVYRDTHHLTSSISAALAPQLVALLESIPDRSIQAAGQIPSGLEAGVYGPHLPGAASQNIK
jgi:peptidoglycan/LPS O-acetylase OafA/YrhL